MSQFLIPLLNFLLVLVISLLQPGGVSINMNAPTEVVAGSEFEVRVTVNKGDLESFSRFQMDIPAGLTASSYLSSNADFTFSEKRVRLIWLRMPAANQMTFAFKVKVDERLKGTFSIDGLFSFIMNNERKSISTNPQEITILPSPTVDPDLIVDVNEFEQKVIQRIPSVSDDTRNIACLRQKPYQNPAASEYIVNLLISKEDKKKFAKIEEKIPEEYTAVAIETKDGIFTFRNQVVKFLWNILPAESDFIVSYRLIPKNGAALKAPLIKGTFSFMVEDKTLSVDVVQVDKELENLSDMEIRSLIEEVKSRPVENPTEEKKTIQPGIREPLTANKTTAKKVKKGRANTGGRKSVYLLEPESGVYYRVQLAAGHRPVDVRRYFRKFRLDMDVREEKHDGWIKYSIGSWKIYKDARDYRVHIWNTTEIDDAFVSAYNNGKRITVQEALMIADQKWYK